MAHHDSASPSSSPGIRWWPVPLILALAAGALVSIWSSDAANAQGQVESTMAVVVLTGLLLLIWLLVASRLPWSRRWAVLGLLAVAAGAFAVLFRIEGVTGNLVPIVTWRFAAVPDLGELAGGAQTATTPWDSPQFLGPSRNGEFPDIGLSIDWQSKPPRELWRREVGEGWSSFAVVGDTAVTLEQRERSEWVVAYRLRTGEPLWTHAIPEAFESVIGGNGPRSTPTISGGTVFVCGATGVLRALHLADGRLLWRRDLKSEYGGQMPEWGLAGSPLVTPHGVVVVLASGPERLLIAFDAASGEEVWTGGSDAAGYSSPMWAEIAGTAQILVLGHEFLTSLDPASGATLWQAAFDRGSPNVAQPVVVGERRVLVSKGYGVGSRLFEARPPEAEVGTWQVETLWDSPRLKSKFANIVLHKGVLYGLDDGVLVAVDPKTGDRLWKKGRYGHGQILLVGDTILVQTEDGELVLVAATPEAHRELSRMPALSQKSWNQPVLAGRYLLVRNHKEAVVYELQLAPS